MNHPDRDMIVPGTNMRLGVILGAEATAARLQSRRNDAGEPSCGTPCSSDYRIFEGHVFGVVFLKPFCLFHNSWRCRSGKPALKSCAQKSVVLLGVASEENSHCYRDSSGHAHVRTAAFEYHEVIKENGVMK
jgi:hypothetical protein